MSKNIKQNFAGEKVVCTKHNRDFYGEISSFGKCPKTNEDTVTLNLFKKNYLDKWVWNEGAKMPTFLVSECEVIEDFPK